jgi:hypothetical protein
VDGEAFLVRMAVYLVVLSLAVPAALVCDRRHFQLHAALLASSCRTRALQLNPACPLPALATVKSVRSKFRSTVANDQLRTWLNQLNSLQHTH